MFVFPEISAVFQIPLELRKVFLRRRGEVEKRGSGGLKQGGFANEEAQKHSDNAWEQVMANLKEVVEESN